MTHFSSPCRYRTMNTLRHSSEKSIGHLSLFYRNVLFNLFLINCRSAWHRLHFLPILFLPFGAVFSGVYSWPFGQCVFLLLRNPFANPPRAKPERFRLGDGSSNSLKEIPATNRALIVSPLSPLFSARSAKRYSCPST